MLIKEPLGAHHYVHLFGDIGHDQNPFNFYLGDDLQRSFIPAFVEDSLVAKAMSLQPPRLLLIIYWLHFDNESFEWRMSRGSYHPTYLRNAIELTVTSVFLLL